MARADTSVKTEASVAKDQSVTGSNLSEIKCSNCLKIDHMKRDCASASKSRKIGRKFKKVGQSFLAMNSVNENLLNRYGTVVHQSI